MIFIDAAEGGIVGLSTNRQNTRQGIHMGMKSFGGLAFFAPVLRKS
jgi:hypothetical protein